MFSFNQNTFDGYFDFYTSTLVHDMYFTLILSNMYKTVENSFHEK